MSVCPPSGALHLHWQCGGEHPGATAGPHGDDPGLGLCVRGEDSHSRALPYPSGSAGGGARGGAGSAGALGPGEPHQVVLPGEWCQEPAEAHQQGVSKGGPGNRVGRGRSNSRAERRDELRCTVVWNGTG